MYKKSDKVTNTNVDLCNYIEGNDVYNSKLIDILSNVRIPKRVYEITVHQYRPDLIAEEIYGSTDYLGLLLLQCGVSLDSYVKGAIITVLPKEELDRILDHLNLY